VSDVESTLFADAGTMEQDCVMENSEAIVAVKMAISIRDISQTGRTAFGIINAVFVISLLLILQRYMIIGVFKVLHIILKYLCVL